ncbi:hypothetical protein PCLA_01r0319 [Pseudomonas citronellolis]|nr:hypothetical protein PCLA_01r0319 [Pseudomonas citronellolis]
MLFVGASLLANRMAPGLFASKLAPTGEWRGWGSVGADLIREPSRWFRSSRTRSAPTGEEYRAPQQPVGAGPARDIARRARSYRGMARAGQRRSGSHPRTAPVVPVIADKIRSLGGMPCFPATCRSGPCPRFRAQGPLLQGNGVGGAA